VVNVRKQDLSEQAARRKLAAAFTERFRSAAGQLGGTSPAERLAGVYAMAALADEYPARRQQCVDVLCGYLRLPFDPVSDELAVMTTDTTFAFAAGKTVTTHVTPAARPFERQVRDSIVTVVREHTQLETSPSWSDLNFNLTGAHFVDANFGGATFRGASTSFEGATFSGAYTSFGGATFSGDSTTFGGATFSGDSTSFWGATFEAAFTTFGGATFEAASTWFDRATFSSASTFVGATFSGASTFVALASFVRANFNGGTMSFEAAKFIKVSVVFDEVIGRSARITGLADPMLDGGATITADGSPFTGWETPTSTQQW